MEVELKSDWADTQVELLKSLYGYKVSDVNDEKGYVDYEADNGDERKKLLRVIVDPDFNTRRADFKVITNALDDLDDGGYDEAVIMANRFTKASKRLVRKEENIEYVSPKHEHYSLIELVEAIQNETRKLCEMKCGKYPQSAEDCKGFGDGVYNCQVRRVSDDADFHAERGWLELLFNDFSRLLSLRREI